MLSGSGHQPLCRPRWRCQAQGWLRLRRRGRVPCRNLARQAEDFRLRSLGLVAFHKGPLLQQRHRRCVACARSSRILQRLQGDKHLLHIRLDPCQVVLAQRHDLPHSAATAAFESAERRQRCAGTPLAVSKALAQGQLLLGISYSEGCRAQFLLPSPLLRLEMLDRGHLRRFELHQGCVLLDMAGVLLGHAARDSVKHAREDPYDGVQLRRRGVARDLGGARSAARGNGGGAPLPKLVKHRGEHRLLLLLALGKPRVGLRLAGLPRHSGIEGGACLILVLSQLQEILRQPRLESDVVQTCRLDAGHGEGARLATCR
mmetsp:Transcript_104663/g.223726  ORF Transcript_104663/g.223726 Transcript_104663/m.223726 type:complete len:316 (-) Transcript_104663:384-1331(-)